MVGERREFLLDGRFPAKTRMAPKLAKKSRILSLICGVFRGDFLQMSRNWEMGAPNPKSDVLP